MNCMKFKVGDILQNIIGYKGLPFPLSLPPGKSRTAGRENILSDGGSPLWKKDMQGRWYFMPVIFSHKEKEYEIPNAVISITGSKTIVETPMVGRQGTVKELINIKDYDINIAGVAMDSDFPESQLKRLSELFKINEAVKLKCALTDIFLDEDDQVVIRSMDFVEMKGTETAQIVKMSLVSDRSFELII